MVTGMAIDALSPLGVPATSGRDRILEAAAALLVEESYGGLTLRKIATRAGMSAPGVLRHFDGKDDILAAVLVRLVEGCRAWISANSIDVAEPDGLVALARRIDSLPYCAGLLSTLVGAATSPSHPAHGFFVQQYVELRAAASLAFERLAHAHDPALDPAAEAVRFLAGWDGLQLHSLYGSVSVIDGLTRRLATLQGRPVPRRALPTTRFGQDDYLAEASADDSGYAVGRERRAEIVDLAITLFAREGFHGASLREIAGTLSIPKSTLLHHFPSKEALLQAVLARRDTTIVLPRSASAVPARDELAALVEQAQKSAERPGLIAVYSVLASEGAAPKHPAHEYFARRLGRVRRYVADLLLRLEAEGSLRPGLDPHHEASWLIAVWDGLQLQWLYDPATVDFGAHLAQHVNGLLVESEQQSGARAAAGGDR
jgi:AcrR family transcriptional regulator